MAYADFSFEDVEERLRVTITTGALFPDVRPVAVPQWLTDQLARNSPLALLNEKSRSERIVAPVLSAVEATVPPPCAVYSGYRLDVDREAGLVGECDFLIALTAPVPLLRAPIVSVVEAKKADVELGYGQGIAQMVGAARFNSKNGLPDRPMYGCVTTGIEWQFLRLDATLITLDTTRRLSSDLGTVLGIFRRIADEFRPPA